MKLPDKINPAHCASKDQTRYILNGVLLTGDLAVATDGRMLFACRATREEDDDARDAIVPTKAALAGFKARRHGIVPALNVLPKVENLQSECRVMTSLDESTTFREIEGTFPNFAEVVRSPETHKLKVGINVPLLVKLAKAFGDDMLTLNIDVSQCPIDHHDRDRIFVTQGMLVTGSSPEAVAVIMPCRPNGGLKGNTIIERIAEIREARKAERLAAEAEAKAKAEAEKTTPEPATP